MSYAEIEPTAIISAEPVETMAMKSMIRIATAPDLPTRTTAIAGGTRPAPASAGVSLTPSAVAARPSEVASEKGMQNQTRPPSM